VKNTMWDLRNHLFETLESLKDKEDPMEIGRAQAIGDIAKQLIETAKVEVAYAKVTGAEASTEFFETPDRKASRPQLAAGGTRSVR